MHFSIHHHTVSELIYSRVDAEKDYLNEIKPLEQRAKGGSKE